MTLNVAVILSGCGYLDGAEIRESVISLLALDRQDAHVTLFAPDKKQHHVVNHLTGEETAETRNVLVESARIARGKIQPLDALNANAFDALVLPGGFGVAKNLSDFAFQGASATIDPAFKHAVQAFLRASKPIAAICIAPAVLVAALGTGTVTIGDDADTASAITQCGGTHQNCATHDIVIDKQHRIVSCSAYMREDRISAVADGIEACIAKTLELAKNTTQRAA